MPSAGALYIAVKGDTKNLVKALKRAENVTIQSSAKMESSLKKVASSMDLLRKVSSVNIEVFRELHIFPGLAPFFFELRAESAHEFGPMGTSLFQSSENLCQELRQPVQFLFR